MEPQPIANSREARLLYFESSTNDWYLELEGQRLAVLRDPEWAEMFWSSFRADLLEETPEVAYTAFSLRDWDACRYTLRHVDSGVTAPFALIAGFNVDEFKGDRIYAPVGRITLRGVYPDPPQPTLLEHLLLACRFLKRVLKYHCS